MIVIVTDSTAYLSREEAKALGVVVVPMTYSIDGHPGYSEGYIEQNDRAEQFVANHMGNIHTSQATFASFHNAFLKLREAGYEILCITISSRLSGTYSNAVLAAREMQGLSIAVVDSLSSCAGMYMLIKEARDLIRSGTQLFETARHIEARREHIRTVFSVDDMEPLRRSGRLGNVKMSISTILNIRPLLMMENGSIVSAGVARGRNEQLRRLRSFAANTQSPLILERFLGDAEADSLRTQLTHDDVSFTDRRVGPVLGAHLGTGCVGLTWMAE